MNNLMQHEEPSIKQRQDLAYWFWVLWPVLALLTFAVGQLSGLYWAPADRYMQDVSRILYVHVPAAWLSLVAYTVTFLASIAFLWTNRLAYDALAEASAEVGVLFNAILLLTGSIWGRPTWGVWWTWDARLTSAAIMFLAFAGYLALRQFLNEPQRRASLAATTAIIVFANVILVWFSVKWWNTLHQIQSSPATMHPDMVWVLRLNAFAFLFLYIWFTAMRYQLSRRAQRHFFKGPEHD